MKTPSWIRSKFTRKWHPSSFMGKEWVPRRLRLIRTSISHLGTYFDYDLSFLSKADCQLECDRRNTLMKLKDKGIKMEKKSIYKSTKTYGHEVGLSAAFRQWRAESHCRLIHGYALSFKFVFESEELDVRNWVVDFGGLKPLKAILEDTFDHKTLVAEDDPEIEWFKEAEKRGILELVVLPSAGCEKFAEYVYEVAEQWLIDAGYGDRCSLVSVEVSEHGANSAIFEKR